MRITLVILTLLISACGEPQPPLVASDVNIAQPMPGMKMTAGYLVLTNNTDEPIRITSVSSPQFAAVEIHETKIEDGVARMRELEALVVPAQGSVTLERGGKHLMLMGFGVLGDAVSLQLMSDGAPVLSIEYSFPQGDDDAG